jgi:hypothetical protein
MQVSAGPKLAPSLPALCVRGCLPPALAALVCLVVVGSRPSAGRAALQKGDEWKTRNEWDPE